MQCRLMYSRLYIEMQAISILQRYQRNAGQNSGITGMALLYSRTRMHCCRYDRHRSFKNGQNTSGSSDTSMVLSSRITDEYVVPKIAAQCASYLYKNGCSDAVLVLLVLVGARNLPGNLFRKQKRKSFSSCIRSATGQKHVARTPTKLIKDKAHQGKVGKGNGRITFSPRPSLAVWCSLVPGRWRFTCSPVLSVAFWFSWVPAVTSKTIKNKQNLDSNQQAASLFYNKRTQTA